MVMNIIKYLDLDIWIWLDYLGRSCTPLLKCQTILYSFAFPAFFVCIIILKTLSCCLNALCVDTNIFLTKWFRNVTRWNVYIGY